MAKMMRSGASVTSAMHKASANEYKAQPQRQSAGQTTPLVCPGTLADHRETKLSQSLGQKTLSKGF